MGHIHLLFFRSGYRIRDQPEIVQELRPVDHGLDGLLEVSDDVLGGQPAQARRVVDAVHEDAAHLDDFNEDEDEGVYR